MTVPRTFQARVGIKGPDETYIFPLLNSNDVFSGLPAGLLDDFSLAMGEIPPLACSKIHVHPVVTQVTFVLTGRLEVRLRAPDDEDHVTLDLAEHQAVLVRPGAFLQLINRSLAVCRTLYIVGPAYAFEVEDETLVYDDSIALDESWDDLRAVDWKPSSLPTEAATQAAREAAVNRLGRRPRE